MFNVGSPWNVVAGEGSANLEELVKHYENQREKQESARVARMRDGKVVTVYDS